jgi:hypothetical protein
MPTSTNQDPFHQVFGPPAIAVPRMHFRGAGLEHMMTRRLAHTGSGWFLGRMFQLFGDGLDRLNPCVEAWSFLLPPALERWLVIGFNAYGALLLLDEAGEKGTVAPIWMIDPLTVTCFGHPQLYLYSLLDDWLPNRRLPRFLDTAVYEQYLRAAGSLLENDEFLGIRAPLPLGGSIQLDNFSRVDIIDYYAATAPVYREALERTKQ